MKTYKELRQEAWKIVTSRWFFRFFVVASIFLLILVGVRLPLAQFFKDHDIQTWGMFAESWSMAKRQGVEMTVASSQQFWSMTWASALESFVEFLTKGIVAFGLTMFMLKAVRNDNERWFAGAFAGFWNPLEVFWLTLLMYIRIVLWTLLFIIPGIIAALRYSMAWYIKAEHPEYSAWKCLAESGKLMKGHNLEVLGFGLSYVGWGILGGLGMGIAVAFWNNLFGAVLMPAATLFFAFVLAYSLFGNVVFYTELKKLSNSKTDNPGTDVVS